MDRLKGLEYYKRIVELGSFTAVAEEFDCSNAVISKYVKYLEDWTGARLVNRNTRRISITEEGQSFYDYCVNVLASTDQVLDVMAQDDNASGQLVVACPVSMSVKILAPVLFRFQKAYPGLTVRLRLSDEITDVISEGVDVALRGTGTLTDSSLVATAIGHMDRCLVASPDYLEAQGVPDRIEALSDHQCLIFSLSQDSLQWEFGNDSRRSVPVSGPLIADSSQMLVEGAKAGLGIALVPKGYVLPELEAGTLTEIHLRPQPTPRTLYVVYPGRQHMPKRTRLFIDFLKAHTGELAGLRPANP
ncbi:LysR family transcriptional regulator [Marinobacter zhejiangensis]|uniref:Transcriptional regulator, LysR family n=1 Tax=Marinobacter zhejiangensis TaxID=488535 RepID=A0A1I4MBN3_9GAMM|nr:LysR family transcriptional regulator [Marinobacter zhejiangensis]SFM00347.1 transcriptional regulator, LysR family [Marinobacter zhejiangensis]